VGDAKYLTDGSNPDVTQNTYKAELDAINATLLANPASVGCTPAKSAGSSSLTAVNCYLDAVPSAALPISPARGLDSSNAYCGPVPCAVLGLRPAAFGGINPAVGSNVMFFPTGRSKYQAVHVAFKTGGGLPVHAVRHVDLAVSYTYSKYESNVAAGDGSGGDFSLLSVAEDYRSPHVGHFGLSGWTAATSSRLRRLFDLLHGLKLSLIAQMLSPLSTSARLPQLDGGGVAGEIFRTDATGDGTVGDLLPGTKIGGLGGYSAAA